VLYYLGNNDKEKICPFLFSIFDCSCLNLWVQNSRIQRANCAYDIFHFLKVTNRKKIIFLLLDLKFFGKYTLTVLACTQARAVCSSIIANDISQGEETGCRHCTDCLRASFLVLPSPAWLHICFLFF
jgi:hypothetical protein